MLLTKLSHSEAGKYICTFSQKKNNLVPSRPNEENSPSERQISRVVARDF